MNKKQLEDNYILAKKTFKKGTIEYLKTLTTPFGGKETIIYSGKGLGKKIKYDLETYNDELVHSKNNEIKITSFNFTGKVKHI